MYVCVYVCAYVSVYHIHPIKRTVPNKRIPHYFSRLEGEWLAQLSWETRKTSPQKK